MGLIREYREKRREYMRHPTRAAKRAFLIAKARRGKFDERFFTFHGVNGKVNSGCRRAATRAYAALLVPTDTLRPQGSSGSYHAQRNRLGQGLGIDFGNIPGLRPGERGWPEGRKRLVRFQAAEHKRHTAPGAAAKYGNLVELIGPDNGLVILRDHQTNLAEGSALETQHDNHVHEAYLG